MSSGRLCSLKVDKTYVFYGQVCQRPETETEMIALCMRVIEDQQMQISQLKSQVRNVVGAFRPQPPSSTSSIQESTFSKQSSPSSSVTSTTATSPATSPLSNPLDTKSLSSVKDSLLRIPTIITPSSSPKPTTSATKTTPRIYPDMVSLSIAHLGLDPQPIGPPHPWKSFASSSSSSDNANGEKALGANGSEWLSKMEGRVDKLGRPYLSTLEDLERLKANFEKTKAVSGGGDGAAAMAAMEDEAETDISAPVKKSSSWTRLFKRV